MTQKSDPYIKLFTTLSRIRILSQLNILSTALVLHYYNSTLNLVIYPLFTLIDMLRRLFRFSNVLDFNEAVISIYQNVQYFIRSKNCVLSFVAVRYSLHTKNYNLSSACHLFSSASKFMEAKNLPLLWLISYSGELRRKKIVWSKLPRPRSPVTMLGPSNQDALIGCQTNSLEKQYNGV